MCSFKNFFEHLECLLLLLFGMQLELKRLIIDHNILKDETVTVTVHILLLCCYQFIGALLF